MTQEEKDRIDYMISVMQAYKEGKEIECKRKVETNWYWNPHFRPSWDWQTAEFRVKPEPPKPKYRPFESAEEVMAAVKEHGAWLKASDGTYTGIVNVLEDMLYLRKSILSCHYDSMLKENYTFADGTPFGKLIE